MSSDLQQQILKPPRLHQKSIFTIRDAHGVIGASLVQQTVIENQRLRQKHRIVEHDFFVEELPRAGLREKDVAAEAIRRRVAATAVVDLARLTKKRLSADAATAAAMSPLPNKAQLQPLQGDTPSSSADATSASKSTAAALSPAAAGGVSPTPAAALAKRAQQKQNQQQQQQQQGHKHVKLDQHQLQLIHQRHQQQQQAALALRDQQSRLELLPELAADDDEDDDEFAPPVAATSAAVSAPSSPSAHTKKRKQKETRPKSVTDYSWVFRGDSTRHTPFDFCNTAAQPFPADSGTLRALTPSPLLVGNSHNLTSTGSGMFAAPSSSSAAAAAAGDSSPSHARRLLVSSSSQQQQAFLRNNASFGSGAAAFLSRAASRSNHQHGGANNRSTLSTSLPAPASASDALVQQLELLRLRTPTPSLSEDVSFAFTAFNNNNSNGNGGRQSAMSSGYNNDNSFAFTECVVASHGAMVVGSPHRSAAARSAAAGAAAPHSRNRPGHELAAIISESSVVDNPNDALCGHLRENMSHNRIGAAAERLRTEMMGGRGQEACPLRFVQM